METEYFVFFIFKKLFGRKTFANLLKLGTDFKEEICHDFVRMKQTGVIGKHHHRIEEVGDMLEIDDM